ncbi:MAG: pentapeptide repeat-containing protein [Mariniphaga sp.]|nr:pentapeptide repeat-containing protein [Mariniphaga sp.]
MAIVKKHKKTGNQIDLNNIKFINEKIESRLLQSVIFENSEFNEIIFKDCDLTGSVFFGCKFINCSFSESVLNKCEFHDCAFTKADFKNSQLVKTEMNNCKLPFLTFSKCNLDWSFLNNYDLREVHFDDISLEGAIIVDCKLFNTKSNIINFGEKHLAKIVNIDFSSELNKSRVIHKNEFLELIKWKKENNGI